MNEQELRNLMFHRIEAEKKHSQFVTREGRGNAGMENTV